MRQNEDYFDVAIRKARTLCEHYDYGKQPLHNYNPQILISNIIVDYEIHYESFYFKRNDFCGMLNIDEFETTIVVNRNHTYQRQYFTLAHELGHYFLHRNESPQFVDNTSQMLGNAKTVQEQQANAFAAEFLIPEKVLSVMLFCQFNFFRIAKTTKTSYECLKWRLVTYLIRNLKITRDQCLILIDDYKKNSSRGIPESAEIFSLLFHSTKGVFAFTDNLSS